jgi:hypothetical protein
MSELARNGMTFLPRCHWLAVLLALLLCLPPAASGRGGPVSPRDELLHLVPDDLGLCLVVTDLRGQSEKLLRTPWLKAALASPLGKTLAESPEFKQLGRIDTFLRQQLNTSWRQLCDELLGDAVVFAYRPGPPGRPEKEQGLALLRARDPALLARLIERINEDQKKSGELKALEARVHNGVTYYRRAEAKGDRFYWARGPLLAYTGEESLLRRVIDLSAAPRPPAAASVLAARLRGLGADRSLAALWINPRTLDAELQRAADNAPAADGPVLKHFLVYWRALDGIALTLNLHPGPELAMAVQVREADLPPSARRFGSGAAGISALWERIPPDALLAVAGKVDVAALVESMGEFLTGEARQAMAATVNRTFGAALGLDVVRDVLPQLGPDWGLFLTAPANQSDLPQLTFALRVRPGTTAPPVDQALLKALNSLAMLAVLTHNTGRADEVRLKVVMQGPVEVKYLASDKAFPPGVQPAFALKDGYLLLATSPEGIRAFGAAPTVAPPKRPAGEVPLLRVAPRGWSQFLKDRREALVAALAVNNEISRETAGQWVANLHGVLDLFDRLEVTQRAETGQAVLILRLHPAAQLQTGK